jgi:hypothetical protein
MRRLPWLFLFGLFFAGCVCSTEPTNGDCPKKLLECSKELEARKSAPALRNAQVVDVTKGPVKIAAGFTGERIVNVSGPSTVHVIQDGKVVFAAHWRHPGPGSLSVPLEAVADTTRPLTIGEWSGPIEQHEAWNWGVAPNCVDCVKTALHKCCFYKSQK